MSVPLRQASRLDSLQTQVRRSLEFLALLPLIGDLRFYPLLHARVLSVLDGDLRRNHHTIKIGLAFIIAVVGSAIRRVFIFVRRCTLLKEAFVVHTISASVPPWR